MNEGQPYPKPRGLIVVGVIILALVGGFLGTALALDIARSNTTVRGLLGFATDTSGNPIVSTKKEQLVLQESSAITDTASKVSPSVVSITSSANVSDYFGNTVQQQGAGTGFIITSDGLILTNKHVVSQTNASYTVIASDGKTYTATVLSTDPILDLAVVKIDAKGLPVVDLGNSDDLSIGQWVVAIGNALGQFQNTVTVGVVSAKNRQITASGEAGGASEQLDGLLQTDAAINPGNSGGPLVNLKGQVVGINTAVSTDAQGIGFAIPINLAKSAIDSVEKTGKIIRPMLGVRYVPVTKQVAKLENLTVQQGALVIGGQDGSAAVLPGSAADKAGIKENDVITEVNNEQITDVNSLSSLLAKYQVGDTVTLKVVRAGKEQDIKVTLQASS